MLGVCCGKKVPFEDKNFIDKHILFEEIKNNMNVYGEIRNLLFGTRDGNKFIWNVS